MAQFGRKLNDDGLKALEDALTLPEQGHWWRDLLSLWYPSGQSTGDYGLRLAIRNGYMNFYRRGQSIARVSLQNRKPILSVHAKYVLAVKERQAVKGQEYVTLTTDSLVRRGGQSALPYKGIETLKAWVRAVDEEYTGPEKLLVDDGLGVALGPAHDGGARRSASPMKMSCGRAIALKREIVAASSAWRPAP